MQNKILHVVLLLILAWSCYSRTLGSYFIADDFPEIAYVSNIFHGHPELILSNFTGNYMQVPGMQVYRPGFLITIIFDYMCYGGKAWGYFLSNLLYFSADVVTLYFLCRVLTTNWFQNNSVLFAVSSAALFAGSPLHCEAITWMVGRGDPDSAFYYLLSLLLFVKHLARPHPAPPTPPAPATPPTPATPTHPTPPTRPILMAFSVLAFAVALSIKEMPVGLPAVAAVIAFFWTDAPSFRLRFLNSLRFSWPFWATLAVYFLIRYLSLGTLGGGYVGGVGQPLSAILRHWTDRDTVERIFLPVTAEVARQSMTCLPILRTLYAFACSLFCIRLLAGCWSWRFIFFISAFLLTTAAPLFQLWGLGPNLEGGRFYFYLSLPLSMIMPLLLFHPAKTTAETQNETQTSSEQLDTPHVNPGRFGLPLTALSIVAQVLMVVMLARVTAKTNMLWVHAGKEDLHLSKECQRLAEQTDSKKQIVLLGIPDDYHGAHLILNRTMFDLMLRPPFVNKDVSNRFLTTIPLIYGPGEYINGSRLRELLTKPDVVGPYLWMRDKHVFEAITLPNSHSQDLENLSTLNERLGNNSSEYVRDDHHGGAACSVFLDHLNLNPLEADCMEFKLQSTDSDNEPLKIYWNGSNAAAQASETEFTDQNAKIDISKTNEPQTIRVRLGHYWRWYSCGRIKSIEIVPPRAKTIRIQNIRILPYDSVAPTLTLQTAAPDHYLAPVSGDIVNLNLSKNAVPGTASMELEVGKSNYFFDNFQGNNEQEPVASKIPLSSNATTYTLSKPAFPHPGYYQLRLRCLDKRRMPVGEYSDAVTLLR